MRVYKPTFKDRDGNKKPVRKWYVEFKDPKRTLRRMAGFRDKKATMEFGRKVEKKVMRKVEKLVDAGEQLPGELSQWVEALPSDIRDRLSHIGLLNAEQAAAGRTLVEHLSDYEKALRARKNSPRYVQQVIAKVKKICNGCAFKYWSDIDAAKVYQYLDSLRDNGNGIS